LHSAATDAKGTSPYRFALRNPSLVAPVRHYWRCADEPVQSGVLDGIFEKLQFEQIIRIKLEKVCLDSPSIKVHPDGTGALKKRTTVGFSLDSSLLRVQNRACACLFERSSRQKHGIAGPPETAFIDPPGTNGEGSASPRHLPAELA
jgi:hypothetical protein